MKGEPKFWMKGVVTAMITPFKENGDLDEETLRSLTDRLIEQGVHFLFPDSTTGEAEKLSEEEKKRVIDMVVDQANGKLPVTPGTGGVSTRATIEMTKYAKDAGADAVIIVTPYYHIPTEDALFEHYKTVSDKVDIPIVLYDCPTSTGYQLSADCVARLANIDNVVGIKDSAGDMMKLTREIQLVGNKIAILQGQDILTLPSLVIGAAGGVLGMSNICPHLWVEMYDAFTKGNLKKALEIHTKLIPLWYVCSKHFQEVVKESLNMMGISVGKPRKPTIPLTAEESKELREALTGLELLKEE